MEPSAHTMATAIEGTLALRKKWQGQPVALPEVRHGSTKAPHTGEHGRGGTASPHVYFFGAFRASRSARALRMFFMMAASFSTTPFTWSRRIKRADHKEVSRLGEARERAHLLGRELVLGRGSVSLTEPVATRWSGPS